mmetsp:Transcript_33570/g.107932  ORF Transcript_33570/g.107932 Transcript_33570/m.107932 type:complete len:197 (+) Transcript_33570:304-894(+)
MLSRGAAKDSVRLSEKIVAGALTGALGSALANPLDVIRVRMSCEGGVVSPTTGELTTGMRAGHKPRWHSSWHCLRDTAAREGVMAGLWRGVGATVARAALLSSGNLASYDHSKVALRRRGWEDDTPLHVACAIIAGLVATTVCNPADVIKSAIMSAERDGVAGLTVLGAARNVLRTFFIQMPIIESLRRSFGVDTI